MGTLEYFLILIAGCLVIYFMAIFFLQIKTKNKVLWGDFKKWLKNGIDSLFGIG